MIFFQFWSIASIQTKTVPIEALDLQISQVSLFHDQIKSNLLLYLLYYSEACNKFAKPIPASLRPGNTGAF